jgi:hypothetical protein
MAPPLFGSIVFLMDKPKKGVGSRMKAGFDAIHDRQFFPD